MVVAGAVGATDREVHVAARGSRAAGAVSGHGSALADVGLAATGAGRAGGAAIGGAVVQAGLARAVSGGAVRDDGLTAGLQP